MRVILMIVLAKLTFLALYKMGVPKEALFTVLGFLALGSALYMAHAIWPDLFKGSAVTDAEAEVIHLERQRQLALQEQSDAHAKQPRSG